MTAVDFFLVCFIVGFVLSLVSFMAGALHIDLSHHGGHLFHGGHVGGDVHGALPQGPHAAGPESGPTISPFSFSSLMVFLAWFGGAGALLVSQLHVVLWVALAGSAVSGLVGATLVFLFLVKVLLPHDTSMKPWDYRLVGTVATLTLGIREGGTGEITYSQGGTRKLVAARAADAAPIPKGTEVVVMRFEQGIAYVRRWDELSGAAKPKELGEGKS